MKAKPKTLGEFTRGARARDCKVCALPEPVLKQIQDRNRHSCSLEVVVAWLASEYGIAVTVDDFRRHQRGGHPAKTASRY